MRLRSILLAVAMTLTLSSAVPTTATATSAPPLPQPTYDGSLSWNNQSDVTNTHAGVMSGAKSKVYLVFWGSEWGTQSTDAQGNVAFSNDTYGAAGMAQRFFKAVGNGETWSNSLTQYCNGPNMTYKMPACPLTPISNFIPYQAGGVLAGVLYDNRSYPSEGNHAGLSFEADTMTEAVWAAKQLGNTSDATNGNAVYVVMSGPGTNPSSFLDYPNDQDPKTGHFGCGDHSRSTDPRLLPAFDLSAGTVYFADIPYTPDLWTQKHQTYCGINSVNGSAGALDGFTATLGHEWAETLTDKDMQGWLNLGNLAAGENGDECAPPSGSDASGWSPYLRNVSFGSAGTFVMQGLWSNHTHSCTIDDPLNVAPATPTSIVAVPALARGQMPVTIPGMDANTTQVVYNVDGNPVGVSTSGGSFPSTIDTTKLSNGTHTISATPVNSFNAEGGTSPSTSFTSDNTPLYQLSADHSKILKWNGLTGSASAWTQIGGPAAKIYDGGLGLFALATDGSVTSYNSGANSWNTIIPAGSPTAELAVTDLKLYVRTTGGNVFVWTGNGQYFTQIGSGVTRIFGGGYGMTGTTSDGSLYLYYFSNNSWARISGPAAEFATSESHVYALSSDRSHVSMWTGGTNWADIGDAAGGTYDHLYAGRLGPVVTNSHTGGAYLYVESSPQLQEIGPSAASYSINDEAVYTLSNDGSTVSAWTGLGWDGRSALPWATIGGPADSIAVGG